MTVLFKPNGTLDVTTDPSDLQQELIDKFNVVSGAMKRCKNFRLNEPGVLKTRDGSTILNGTAISETIDLIIVREGVRYIFTTTPTYYRDETAIS